MSLNNCRKRVADRVIGANLCCEESHERRRGIGEIPNYSVAGSPQSKTAYRQRWRRMIVSEWCELAWPSLQHVRGAKKMPVNVVRTPEEELAWEHAKARAREQ
jgi:hypothetical protein